MTLTREQILSADDRATKLVDVPEWGGKLYIRPMSGTERAIIVRLQNDGEVDELTKVVKVVTMCCVDTNGNALFADDDAAALQDKHGGALFDLAWECLNHSGLGDAEETLDDMEKN